MKPRILPIQVGAHGSRPYQIFSLKKEFIWSDSRPKKQLKVSIGGTTISKIDVHHEIPGKLEAEAFINTVGPVAFDDNIAINYWNAANRDELHYKVNIAQPGTYKVKYRYYTSNDSGVEFWLGEQNLTTVYLDSTGGWGNENAMTAEFKITIPQAGEHILRLVSCGDNNEGGDHNLDWFAIGPYIEAEAIDGTIEEGRKMAVRLRLH